MVFESESRWSHHRYVRARRPTLRQEGAAASRRRTDKAIEDNRFAIASGKLSLGTNWLRDAASYWSESLIKNGDSPGLIRRDWVPIEVRDWGSAGDWPCPRLAPRRLTGTPAAFASGGSRCGMRWFLSRYVLAEFQGANTGGLRTPAEKCRPPG